MARKTIFQRVITGPDTNGFFSNMVHNGAWMTLGVVTSESVRGVARTLIKRSAKKLEANQAQAQIAHNSNSNIATAVMGPSGTTVKVQ